MKDVVRKGVVWFFAALGAALAAMGVVSVESWQMWVTPDLVEGVTGVMALIVGGVVAKFTSWAMSWWG